MTPTETPIVNTYRLVSGKHTRWVNGQQETHAANTPTATMTNLTFAEVSAHSFRIELVSGIPPTNPNAPAPDLEESSAPVVVVIGGGDGEESGALDPNYVELLDGVTAVEAIGLIETVFDPKELRAIRSCERNGKERATVLKAIDAQLVKAYAVQKKGDIPQ